ncbi:MAG: CRISPR-associated endonuclease Cas1 [Candidatus Paceibacterota bacterium]
MVDAIGNDTKQCAVFAFNCDFWANAQWISVESKNSAGPDKPVAFDCGSFKLSPDAWPNDQIQLCAQGLLLRENGFDSPFGYLYYRAAKKRVKIDFTDDLINYTRSVIRDAQEATKGQIPPPLLDSPKCVKCSLNVFCLPDEINRLAGKIGEPRKIIPGRDDAGVLYVITQGARVSKAGESIVIKLDGEKVDEIPLKDVAHVVLVGHIQISTEALHLLMESGRTVSFFSAGGRMIGTATAPISKNVGMRVAQCRNFDSDVYCLNLTRDLVEAKIENQRTLIRRNDKTAERELEELKNLSGQCRQVSDIASLRGVEGKAAQVYFSVLPRLIGPKNEAPKDGQQTFDDLPDAQGWTVASEAFFKMIGRTKRPPKDPVNALLSFGYTLLTRDFVSTLIGVGLDPYFGFYHAMEAGRPALALDMMEPFRPLIVDSMVLRIINTGEIKEKHFHCAQTEIQLNKDGRAKFIGAYERRMDELVTHPVFGYRISYRRVLDVECRLLGRFLVGEIAEYKPLRTR